MDRRDPVEILVRQARNRTPELAPRQLRHLIGSWSSTSTTSAATRSPSTGNLLFVDYASAGFTVDTRAQDFRRELRGSPCGRR